MTKKFLIAVMLITFMFEGCSFAADIDLGEGYHVPTNFSSVLITNSDGTAIQNAVERIKAGGTILLSGDFKLKRTINIKKNLTIEGINNAVLDRSKASDKDRVIRCQGDITLKNLTVTGGSLLKGGGGIKIDGGTVNIINCDIYGNTSVLGGGGIHSQAKELTLESCDIHDNTATCAGGGISFLSGTVTMKGCNIYNNTSQILPGGGLGAAGVTMTMNNCKVTGNEATASSGGGIALTLKATLTAVSCDISGNTAKEDADVYVDNSSTYKNDKEEN